MRGVNHGAFMLTRPITLWPHQATTRRQRSQFSAGWSDTRDLLVREARQLGATSLVLQLAVTEEDIRLDGEIRAQARPAHPGVIVSFESRHGPLEYATDVFDRWQDNVRAVALGLEALRRVDRYGIAKRGEQYRGWKQLAAGDDDGGASVQRGRELIAAFGGLNRALRATHPDTRGIVSGGSTMTDDDFRSVQLAGEAGAS